jgi:hypothetical protein
MRRVAIGVAVLVAVLAVGYLGLRILFETSGEVVELRTLDTAGAAHASRVWIVEVDGQLYLRTGNSKSIWLNRLRENPRVNVTRRGVDTMYLATPLDDAALRELVNAAVAAKYGAAEKILRLGILDPRHTVPIRLVPIPSDACDARSAPC